MPYCDHNATAPLRPLSRDAMAHALTITGNPSSVHAHGRAARAVVEKARDLVARLVHAKPDQVIFTSGATEANALALWGAVEGAIDRSETDKSARITRLFVSAIEHSSVLKTAEALAERVAGVRLERLPVAANGVLDLEALRVALREGKGRALVAVMAANNETGVIQPVAEISRLCREAGALLLVDAVTAAGKIDLDAGLGDYMTLSAHKLGGPQGAGALVVGDDAPLAPQMTGGGQQKGLRAGTENLSGIAGFGAAVDAILADAGARARRLGARSFRAHAQSQTTRCRHLRGRRATPGQYVQCRAAGPDFAEHRDCFGSGWRDGEFRFVLFVRQDRAVACVVRDGRGR